jgi:Helicase conserved C-terminal domain
MAPSTARARRVGSGNLYGWEYDPETQRRERFLIAETQNLREDFAYAKECRLVQEVKGELEQGRRCQIYAVYTQKRDVTRRLAHILENEGIRVAVLTTEVPPESREGWYERQLRAGVQAVICHPKLVQTGLDLIEFPTILFYETGYSIYVLRQASWRSWRIGQRSPVRVKFLHYAETMQETCLRLMGRKLLVSLAMEGKFASEGLQALNDEDDILMAMARELVTEKGIGKRAGAVWSDLQKKQAEVFAVKSTETEGVVPAPVAELPTSEDALAGPPPTTSAENIFQKTYRRAGNGNQLALF